MPLGNPSQLERTVRDAVDELRPAIRGLVEAIGLQPELGYQERNAVVRIQALLEAHGHQVETGLADMPTAMRSRTGSGHPHVALLAEYDALPQLGHGCGHNVIAGAAVGAYVALAGCLPDGTIELLGCPAEESAVDGAGGKVRLIAAGAFEGVDAALMVHPYDSYRINEGSLAARGIDLRFKGRSAHASSDADHAINALDAAVQTYNAISMLRQQLSPDVRVHGVFTHAGDTPNVVPDLASLRFRVRARSVDRLDEVLERVLACARGAAMSTGCQFAWSDYVPMYAGLTPNPELVGVARDVLESLGVEVAADRWSSASTDFGNVSQLLPAVEIGIQVAPPGTPLHSAEFAAAALHPRAGDSAVSGALALALTAVRSTWNPAARS